MFLAQQQHRHATVANVRRLGRDGDISLQRGHQTHVSLCDRQHSKDPDAGFYPDFQYKCQKINQYVIIHICNILKWLSVIKMLVALYFTVHVLTYTYSVLTQESTGNIR